MNYAEGIRRARERAGLSKRKLASRAGFNASYVGLLESGKRLPSLDALETIATATEIPMGLLMLMCAEKQDLRGIDVSEANTLIDGLGALLNATRDD
jgi:transcriptional regulator with XRE-family HTH domain